MQQNSNSNQPVIVSYPNTPYPAAAAYPGGGYAQPAYPAAGAAGAYPAAPAPYAGGAGAAAPYPGGAGAAAPYPGGAGAAAAAPAPVYGGSGGDVPVVQPIAPSANTHNLPLAVYGDEPRYNEEGGGKSRMK